MIVDRNVHPATDEMIYRFLQLASIVPGIDPQVLKVRDGESDDFETHERDVLDEGEIPVDEFRQLKEPRVGGSVDDYPEL